MTPQQRAAMAAMIAAGAVPEDVAAGFGISRATLYRQLRKHRDQAASA
jgi:transcriptional regulator of acetoin/glycerol metabolism